MTAYRNRDTSRWRNRLMTGACAIGLALALSGNAAPDGFGAQVRSHDESEALIFERQQTMSQLSKDAELLGQIVAGIAPPEKLAETTAAIAAGARESAAQFSNRIPGGHTRAEAWTNNADFQQRMAAFARNADAMAKAGKTGDVSAVTGLMIEGLPCKQCHDMYRERKPGV